jgi:hypothetical protein
MRGSSNLPCLASEVKLNCLNAVVFGSNEVNELNNVHEKCQKLENFMI